MMEEIQHIVVLMLENRSFDHMLGYLSLSGGRPEVDGLRGRTIDINRDVNGTVYSIEPLDSTWFPVDPNHEADSVALQLAGNNGGFVAEFSRRLGTNPMRLSPGLVMGYHDGNQAWAYDQLARQFVVCDRWFASVPGPTQMNRLYAVAGTSGGLLHHQFPPNPYDVQTVFHHLDQRGISWKWYSHDIASLRWVRDYLTNLRNIDKVREFFERAAEGDLPSVTFIDPDFTNFGSGGAPNDDHPPVDMNQGQLLVARVFNALLAGRNDLFRKTLFIVTYDEHGGFYDHVPPPAVDDDHPSFRRLGVRVPALVVSPWVRGGAVAKQQYDHTTIIKTILKRFWGNDALPSMGRRVAAAADLWPLLTLREPRTGLPPIAARASRSGGDVMRSLRQPTAIEGDLKALADLAQAHGVPRDRL
jgi:phospholipase C